MKRIAYIARNLNINGISSVILNYGEKLNKEKFKIDLFVGEPINEINIKRCNNANIQIIKTPQKRGKNPLKYFVFLKKKLVDYDIVHIHGNSRTIFLELLISRINKNKINIAHCHSIKCEHKLIHYLLTPFFRKMYDYGVACSKAAGKWMFGNSSFLVLQNGIETSKYIYNINTRERIRKELNIEDKFVIGHVGNFSDSKNYPFLLELFEKVFEKNDKARLLLVGNYDNNQTLKNKILSSKYASNIILYGATNKIYELYNAMDIFVFPSKYEGLGIVLVEAQCNGLKCVVSNMVPNEVEIDSKIIKFLSLNDDSEKWILEILKKNNENRKQLYIKNQEKIEQYDINKSVIQLEKIYEKR